MRAKHAAQIRRGIELARAKACTTHQTTALTKLSIKAYARETDAMQYRARRELFARMQEECEVVQAEALKVKREALMAKRDRLQTDVKFRRIIMANYGGES